MRRPGLLIAGMFLATGAGLAVASPSSAAVSHSGADSPHWSHCHSHWNDWDDWDDWDHGGGDWGAIRQDRDGHRRWCHSHRFRDHGHGHIFIGIGGGGHRH